MTAVRVQKYIAKICRDPTVRVESSKRRLQKAISDVTKDGQTMTRRRVFLVLLCLMVGLWAWDVRETRAAMSLHPDLAGKRTRELQRLLKRRGMKRADVAGLIERKQLVRRVRAVLQAERERDAGLSGIWQRLAISNPPNEPAASKRLIKTAKINADEIIWHPKKRYVIRGAASPRSS